MLQQVSDPLGVFDIRLPSRHSFDMLGIDHQHFKTAFQQVEHRLPIYPGGLEGHLRTALFFEPITELQQLLGGAKVGPKFFLKLTIGRVCQHTDLHGLVCYSEYISLIEK